MILITYILYSIITFSIIIRVGHIMYDSGAVYLEKLIPNDVELAHSINKVLLVGYYLMNLGYVLQNLTITKKVESVAEMIPILSYKLGIIIFSIACIHYINLMWMYIYAKYLKRKSMLNNKTQ